MTAVIVDGNGVAVAPWTVVGEDMLCSPIEQGTYTVRPSAYSVRCKGETATSDRGALDRQALDRTAIVARAVAFADEHGTDALSMRKLAAELGYEVMSLYNHVANKAEVLSLMVDAVAAEIPPPAADVDPIVAVRTLAVDTARPSCVTPGPPDCGCDSCPARPASTTWSISSRRSRPPTCRRRSCTSRSTLSSTT